MNSGSRCLEVWNLKSCPAHVCKVGVTTLQETEYDFHLLHSYPLVSTFSFVPKVEDSTFF